MWCGQDLLFFLDTIFLCVATALISVGVWIIKSSDSGYREITKDTSYTLVPSGFIIGVGVLVLIMAIMLLCGMYQNGQRCLTKTFLVLLLLVICLEACAAIVAGIYRNEPKEAVQYGLDDAIKHYHGSSSDALDKALDGLQKDLQCCGNEGPSDWSEYRPWRYLGLFPDSCCKDELCFQGNVYQKGCFDAVVHVLNTKLNYIIGISAGVAVLHTFGTLGVCFVRGSELHNERLRAATPV